MSSNFLRFCAVEEGIANHLISRAFSPDHSPALSFSLALLCSDQIVVCRPLALLREEADVEAYLPCNRPRALLREEADVEAHLPLQLHRSHKVPITF